MCSNRIVALALAGVMVLGLVACSPTDPEPTDTSTPEVTEPADTSEPEQTAPAEPDDQEPQETAETTADTETEVVEPAEAPVEAEPTYSFTSVNETVYATTTVNIREGFSADTDKVGSLGRGQSVKRVGIGTGDAEGWSQVEFNGQTAYISSDYLSLTKPAAQSSGNNSGSQTSQGSSGGQASQSKPSSGSQSSSSGQTQTQQPSTSGGNSYRDTAIPPEMQSQPENWMEEGTGGDQVHDGSFVDKDKQWEGIQ